MSDISSVAGAGSESSRFVAPTPRGVTPRSRRGRLRVLRQVPIYAFMAVVAVIFLFPLLYLLNMALQTPQSFLMNPVSMTTTIDLSNFSDAWQQGNLAQDFLNTLLYTGASTALTVTASLFIGFPIARRYVRWSRLWFTFFVIALFLPSALIPQFQLIVGLHLFNTQLGYILLSAGTGLGFGPLLVTSYLYSIPRELDESASMDGCGYLRFVLTIVAPLAAPVLITAFLLQAIGVWNDIIGPTIYLASPSFAPVSLGLLTFFGEDSTNFTVLAAAVLIVATPLLVLYLVLQRYFMQGALSGAIKT